MTHSEDVDHLQNSKHIYYVAKLQTICILNPCYRLAVKSFTHTNLNVRQKSAVKKQHLKLNINIRYLQNLAKINSNIHMFHHQLPSPSTNSISCYRTSLGVRTVQNRTEYRTWSPLIQKCSRSSTNHLSLQPILVAMVAI